jgi:glycosyltransferase involved in cell wall biosynthesis
VTGQAYRVSVVIPVYQGSSTLPRLVEELTSLAAGFDLPDGSRGVLSEVLLVDDCGPDGSDRVILNLVDAHPIVRPVWLMRNYGQHAATIAGLASSRGDWVVTMDEDGQHDPVHIIDLLGTALRDGRSLAYARAVDGQPHSWLRNTLSDWMKRSVVPLLTGPRYSFFFSSYRVILGDAARSLAAFANQGVYLDIALRWLVQSSSIVEVPFRPEARSESGYRLGKLMSHFLRLVVSAGTRPLRFATVIGLLSALSGFVLVGVVIGQKVAGQVPIQGWASLMAVVLMIGGLTLMMLGLIAEYLSTVVKRSLGVPLYVTTGTPRGIPLSRGE